MFEFEKMFEKVFGYESDLVFVSEFVSVMDFDLVFVLG